MRWLTLKSLKRRPILSTLKTLATLRIDGEKFPVPSSTAWSIMISIRDNITINRSRRFQ